MKAGDHLVSLVLIGVLCSSSAIPAAQAIQAQATSAEISTRLAEVTPPDRNLPDNPMIAYEEIRRLDDELVRYQRDLSRLSDTSLAVTLDTLIASAGPFLESVANLSCDQPDAEKVDSLAGRLDPYFQFFLFNDELLGTAEPNPWDLRVSGLRREADPKVACQR